jgi:cephalosporin hydroxylase
MIDSLSSNIERLKRVTGGSRNCGWMCDEVALLLYALVKFYKPDLVIQTGHLWGKSACVVLEAMTDGFLGNRGGMEATFQDADRVFADFVRSRTPRNARSPRLISIDPEPMGVEHAHAGIELLRQMYPGHFDFRPMTSVQFFESFDEDIAGLRVMGIVDGDHSPEGCLADLEALARLGADTMLVDDTNWLPKLKGVTVSFADRAGFARFTFEPYNGLSLLARHAR